MPRGCTSSIVLLCANSLTGGPRALLPRWSAIVESLCEGSKAGSARGVMGPGSAERARNPCPGVGKRTRGRRRPPAAASEMRRDSAARRSGESTESQPPAVVEGLASPNLKAEGVTAVVDAPRTRSSALAAVDLERTAPHAPRKSRRRRAPCNHAPRRWSDRR